MKGVLSSEILDDVELVERAKASAGLVGVDMVQYVMADKTMAWDKGYESSFAMAPRNLEPKFDVVAIDCGMKRNILRNLVESGCRVTIVPPNVSAKEVLDRKPDGVFISNGPGDPAAVTYAVELLRGLIGKTPIFGICLGHQLLSLALGAKTFKLKFGHRGGNQPVMNLATRRVEITSQNHGFAVDTESLKAVGGQPTHENLNDQTLEGFRHRDLPLFSVQYHPEANPGPHDAAYLFDCFTQMIQTQAAPTPQQMADAQKTLESRR